MLKKIFILLLATLALSGCRSKKAEKVITVKLSGWQSSPTEKHLLQHLLNKFEAKHPNIKVKYEVITDQYMDVIKIRLIGDAAPDVFYLDALEAPLMMKNDVMEPLDKYIKAEFKLTDFEPKMLKAFQYNGITYGIPKDFSTLALFYNKQAFKEVGLTAPPQTWKELVEYSKKLTIDKNRDGRIDQYGFGITPELARQTFMIKAFGGNLINQTGNAEFATNSGLKGLELVVHQYRQDKTSAQPSDVGTNSTGEMLGQGKAAIVFEGSWTIPYLKKTFPNIKFGTAEIPIVAKKKGTMAYTVAYVMNKKSQHKEAAWQLISYLTSQRGMKSWASTGLVLPSRKSVLKELGYTQNPLYAPFIAGAKYATIWQTNENLPTIVTNFNNQFISALIGEQSLRDAMIKAQDTANKEIQASQ